MNSGIALWNKAKTLIPGGNQLLSKRAEMFLPGQWPAYYKKAKGCEVWDLDDNHYYDLSIMGIGSCVLGYADDDVNRAVKDAIDNGSMATLNCYEEVELAEKLIELHPWAGMARYARTGGEACAVAVRIARAYSKKDKIAFCGYHGWHDWYLSSNLSDADNLNSQLLPGLDPAGVPKGLANSAMPFRYGDIKVFKKIVDEAKENLGVIIMEVERHEKADIAFLNMVKERAENIGAVLIFDEVSSGFRARVGGLHTLYGVAPDIVVLGKALGNGFPISVVLGKREVMQAAQDTFISSTYWTERVGFTAALEVIRQFEKRKVIDHIVNMGNYLTGELKSITKNAGLHIDIVGLSSVPIMVIKEKEPLTVKTIFTQEMLKKGFLASNVIYVSYAHTKKIADEYLKAAKEVFEIISDAIKNDKLNSLLKGEICHSGFKRLA